MFSSFLRDWNVPWSGGTASSCASIRNLISWSSPTHSRMRTRSINYLFSFFRELTRTITWVVARFVAASMNVVWILCLCIFEVKPVDSTHFMGGVIQWRPVNPAAFDGRVSDILFCSSIDIKSPIIWGYKSDPNAVINHLNLNKLDHGRVCISRIYHFSIIMC